MRAWSRTSAAYSSKRRRTGPYVNARPTRRYFASTSCSMPIAAWRTFAVFGSGGALSGAIRGGEERRLVLMGLSIFCLVGVHRPPWAREKGPRQAAWQRAGLARRVSCSPDPCSGLGPPPDWIPQGDRGVSPNLTPGFRALARG